MDEHVGDSAGLLSSVIKNIKPCMFAIGCPQMKDVTIKGTVPSMDFEINQVRFKASEEPYKHVKRHILMIRNRLDKSATYCEVPIYTLRPHFPELQLADQCSTEIGSQAIETLSKEFGSSRIQRIMSERKRSSWKPEVMKSINEIKNKSEEQASFNADSSITNATTLNEDDIRPPFLINAKDPKDAYDMKLIAPSSILSTLKEEAALIAAASMSEIEAWEGKDTYSSVVLSRLSYLPNKEEERMDKACKLVLLSKMREMYLAGSKKVCLSKPFPEMNRTLVNNYLLKNFTEEHSGPNRKRHFPVQKKEKLLHWYFVLLLHIDDYKCDTSELATSMKLSVDRIRKIFRFLGCHVKNDLNHKGDKVNMAILHLPLDFPKDNKTLKRKRDSM